MSSSFRALLWFSVVAVSLGRNFRCIAHSSVHPCWQRRRQVNWDVTYTIWLRAASSTVRFRILKLSISICPLFAPTCQLVVGFRLDFVTSICLVTHLPEWRINAPVSGVAKTIVEWCSPHVVGVLRPILFKRHCTGLLLLPAWGACRVWSGVIRPSRASCGA